MIRDFGGIHEASEGDEIKIRIKLRKKCCGPGTVSRGGIGAGFYPDRVDDRGSDHRVAGGYSDTAVPGLCGQSAGE